MSDLCLKYLNRRITKSAFPDLTLTDKHVLVQLGSFISSNLDGWCENVSLSDLQDITMMSRSALCNTLNRLESGGYLVRRKGTNTISTAYKIVLDKF